MVARRRVIGLVALGAALMLAPPASAQNIFQSLFGGLFHHRETSVPARSLRPVRGLRPRDIAAVVA